jgi:hypothetical protein
MLAYPLKVQSTFFEGGEAKETPAIHKQQTELGIPLK